MALINVKEMSDIAEESNRLANAEYPLLGEYIRVAMVKFILEGMNNLGYRITKRKG